MPDDVVALLRAWKPIQTSQRQAIWEAWVDLDLVFTDAVGRPLNLDRVRREFYKVLTAAGIRRLVPYSLRHTSATFVLHETKDVKLVAARLGHANEYLVLRRYGHLLPGVDREATDLLSATLDRVRREASRC